MNQDIKKDSLVFYDTMIGFMTEKIPRKLVPVRFCASCNATLEGAFMEPCRQCSEVVFCNARCENHANTGNGRHKYACQYATRVLGRLGCRCSYLAYQVFYFKINHKCLFNHLMGSNFTALHFDSHSTQ